MSRDARMVFPDYPRRLASSEWMDDAACVGMDHRLFVGTTDNPPLNYNEARAVCAECPVIDECRDYAITLNFRYGLWGGLTWKERKEYEHRTRGSS